MNPRTVASLSLLNLLPSTSPMDLESPESCSAELSQSHPQPSPHQDCMVGYQFLSRAPLFHRIPSEIFRIFLLLRFLLLHSSCHGEPSIPLQVLVSVKPPDQRRPWPSLPPLLQGPRTLFDLHTIFSTFGKVAHITILKDRVSRWSRGVTFILFVSCYNAAATVVQTMDHKVLNGYTLSVSVATDNDCTTEFWSFLNRCGRAYLLPELVSNLRSIVDYSTVNGLLGATNSLFL